MRISTLLFTCAIALSTMAAYYSIVGLATIFSSAFWPVVILATILEVSKLVIASWLYHKWSQVTGPIKIYLTSAVIVLMLITSLGIFGFLSKAHVEQNINNTSLALRIEQIDHQLSSSTEVMNRYRAQLEQLDRSINIQLDGNRATQALAARQRQSAERDQIRQRLDAEQQRVVELQQQRLQLRQQMSVVEGEVGPIRYVAEFFAGGREVDLEQAVRWMIVIIVLVFDPLAVLMLIAANMSWARENRATIQESDTKEHRESTGPAIGEVISIEGRPFKWWDGSAWQSIDERSNGGPAMGDLMIIDDRPVRWWDGSRWMPVDEQKVVDHSEEIRALQRDIRSEINDLRAAVLDRKADIDHVTLSRLVKESMDEWLTKAAGDTQASTSIKDRDASEHKEEVPENAEIPPVTEDRDARIEDPPLPKEQAPSESVASDGKPGKPSWL